MMNKLTVTAISFLMLLSCSHIKKDVVGYRVTSNVCPYYLPMRVQYGYSICTFKESLNSVGRPSAVEVYRNDELKASYESKYDATTLNMVGETTIYISNEQSDSIENMITWDKDTSVFIDEFIFEETIVQNKKKKFYLEKGDKQTCSFLEVW